MSTFFRFALITVSMSLAAVEPLIRPPSEPDPNPPRSVELEILPNPPSAPRVPSTIVISEPEEPRFGDDGIRDVGENQPIPQRPGGMPEPHMVHPGTGDDGIRDPGEGDRTRQRPGMQPQPSKPNGNDGIRDPDEGDDHIRDPADTMPVEVPVKAKIAGTPGSPGHMAPATPAATR